MWGRALSQLSSTRIRCRCLVNNCLNECGSSCSMENELRILTPYLLIFRLPVVVTSMASLMESGLEDGEDSMTISNTYVSILCLVTSETSAMTFDTRKYVLLRYRNSIMRTTWYSCRQVAAYVQPRSPADAFWWVRGPFFGRGRTSFHK